MVMEGLDIWDTIHTAAPANAKELDIWKKAQKKALSIVTLGLDYTQMAKVTKAKSALEVLELLGKEFEAKTQQNQLHLQDGGRNSPEGGIGIV